jgi:hypothetical protein
MATLHDTESVARIGEYREILRVDAIACVVVPGEREPSSLLLASSLPMHKCRVHAAASGTFRTFQRLCPHFSAVKG